MIKNLNSLAILTIMEAQVISYPKGKEPTAFQNPLPIAVVGPTGCGKSTFVKRLIKHRNRMYNQNVGKILYCYRVWDNHFDELVTGDYNVEMHIGLPHEEKLAQLDDGNFNLLILDDLMAQVVNSAFMEDVFSVHGRHYNVSTVFIMQNVFQQGRHSRTISLQIRAFVLFENGRDRTQVKTLAIQMMGDRKYQAMIQAYEDVMLSSGKYGYVVVDCMPDCHKLLGMRTRIFPDDDFPIVYNAKM